MSVIYSAQNVVVALRNNANEFSDSGLRPIHFAAALVGDVYRANEGLILQLGASAPANHDVRAHTLSPTDPTTYSVVSTEVVRSLFGVCRRYDDTQDDLSDKKDILLIGVATVRPTLNEMANQISKSSVNVDSFMDARAGLAYEALRTLAAEDQVVTPRTLVDAALIGATERPITECNVKGAILQVLRS